MSNSGMIAYVAIFDSGRGTTFAYLPNTSITLPGGWKWSVISGRIEEKDISSVAASMRLKSVDAACRVMCRGTGVAW